VTRAVPWRVPAALATALVAVLTVASSLSADVNWRVRLLEVLEPAPARAVAHVAGVLGGVALMALALGVVAGRRRASHAAVVTLVVLAVVHAAKGLDYEEALIALGLAAVLWAGLRAAARGAEPSRRLVAGMLVVLGLSAAYATTVTVLLVTRRSPGVGAALERAAAAAVDGVPVAVGEPARRAVHVAVGLALLALLGAARALVAPERAEDGHDRFAHARAAAIVAEHGTDSIAPFVLRADKAFFFAHHGVLAYRTLGGTAVVSGDPVGPPGTAPAIVAAFLRFAEARAWDVVVTGAGEGHLPAYRALGLRALRIGSEAVADPGAFALDTAPKTLRKAVRRVHRRGFAVRVAPAAALTAREVAEILDVELAWRAAQPRTIGFTMAMDRLLGAPEDAQDTYVVGRAPDGRLRAFLRFVRYRDGLSLDAMRRLGDDPNGLTETLVVALLEHARAAGVREISLNFAGFAHLMAADALLSRGQRIARWGLSRLHGRFQLERLARFNAKFGPAWRPRYLLYSSRTRLPLAALRVLQAEAYLKGPRHRPCRNAWRPRLEHPPRSEPAAERGTAG
jgi:lysyl-tRNA synthetase, class II